MNNVQDCDIALKKELSIGWKRLENTARNPDASFYKNDTLMSNIINIYYSCLTGKKSKDDIINLFGHTSHDYGQELIYDCVDVTNGKIMCFRVRFDSEKIVTKMFYVDCGRVNIDK